MDAPRPPSTTPQRFPQLPMSRRIVMLAAIAVTAAAGCAPVAPTVGGAAGAEQDAGAEAPRAAAAGEFCGRFATAALSSDAAIDRGPADARSRAAQLYGSPQLATQLAGEGRDQTWPELVQHQARVEVRTDEVTDDPPQASGSEVGAAVSATRVAVGTGGWRQVLPATVVYCSLTSAATAGWRVTAVTFSDTTPAESTSAGATR